MLAFGNRQLWKGEQVVDFIVHDENHNDNIHFFHSPMPIS